MKKSHSHKGHRERLRQRYLDNGIDSFNSHEVLELLLYFAIPRINTNDIAHNLLDTFGSLSSVFDAPRESLADIKGMGENSALFLKLIPDICRLYACEKSSSTRCPSSKEALYKMITDKFIGKTNEAVVIMLLNAKMKVLFCDSIGDGTIDSLTIGIKELIKLTLKFDSRFAVLAHNHPSGIALPSNEDIESTNLIRDALLNVDVKLLDHLIIADNDYVSLSDDGIAGLP